MEKLYKSLYLFLFNKITDAITALDNKNPNKARRILVSAQRFSEEKYICKD